MAKEEKSGNDPVVFGMTRGEIEEAADALSRRKDQNHPTRTGTYEDLIKNVRTGREALSKQNGYCREKS
jgi:hypothetical protein